MNYHYTISHATYVDTVKYETETIEEALTLAKMIDEYAKEGYIKITIERNEA